MTTLVIATIAAAAIAAFVAKARADTVTIFGVWEKARAEARVE